MNIYGVIWTRRVNGPHFMVGLTKFERDLLMGKPGEPFWMQAENGE